MTTTVELEIPEDLADSLRRQGLLNPDELREILKDALRTKANAFFSDLTDRVKRAGVPPMSDDEIQAEIDAVRAEQGWK